MDASWETDASGNPMLVCGEWTATVYVDDSPASPAEWSNVGTLAYRTPGYASVGDLPREYFGTLADELPSDAVVSMPVRAWDDRNGTELREADSWDEAQGWMYATHASIAECIGDGWTVDTVLDAMRDELEPWQQWAQGDVYGVAVTGPDGEERDSLWGLYGDDYAREEAARMLEDAIDAEREEAARVARMMRE